MTPLNRNMGALICCFQASTSLGSGLRERDKPMVLTEKWKAKEEEIFSSIIHYTSDAHPKTKLTVGDVMFNDLARFSKIDAMKSQKGTKKERKKRENQVYFQSL